MRKKMDAFQEQPDHIVVQYTATASESPPPCSSCASECCTTATWDYAPTPLSKQEAERLAERVDITDKLIEYDGYPALKVRDNGYCVFVDEQHMNCTIYSLRPFDCRIFPIDWYLDSRGNAWWVLWDCPLAERMSEQQIEAQLVELEANEADYLREMRHYGNQQVNSQLEAEDGLRVLRRIRLDLGDT